MPKTKPDARPQWERDDEDADHKLTPADRDLLLAGSGPAARSGLLAGLLLGAAPACLVLLVRALLGGGWHFDHWVWNLSIYAALAALSGPAMGRLRLWSCRGHRFSLVPLAGVRAGWDTWLGVAVVDAFVIWAVTQDDLGVLLLFAFLGLIWLGLLYSMLWAAIQARLLRPSAGGRGYPATSGAARSTPAPK